MASQPRSARIAAIVPVGTLDRAKSRLGESLDAEERHDLVERLLGRTIAAATGTRALADVVVVSPDPEVRALAAAAGARTIRQRSSGLNAGLGEAREDVMAGGADVILVLPIDLPFVTSAAIEAVLAPLDAGGDPSAPLAVLVTDRHGTGTNALVLRPPDVIGFAFGSGSRAAHRAAAEQAGAAYMEVEGPLSVDLDTPDDLVFVQSRTREPGRAG
jgi:2-phospho-L-lactate/phosphoenolpyruvate guanylyltransferase